MQYSITYESVELRVSTTCSMCWNGNPTRRAFFVALLQTFLYTLAAKTMIAIGVDVCVSAVFQADGTYELFVKKFLEIFKDGGQREYGHGSVLLLWKLWSCVDLFVRLTVCMMDGMLRPMCHPHEGVPEKIPVAPPPPPMSHARITTWTVKLVEEGCTTRLDSLPPESLEEASYFGSTQKNVHMPYN
jgi:hypothetical protein